MLNNINLRNIKWITIIGALINLFISVLVFVNLYSSISGIEELNTINGGVTPTQYSVYSFYVPLINVVSVSIVFSLLLISVSVRIDQFFVRLKWVNIVTGILSISSVAAIIIISNTYQDELVVQIKSPLFYVIVGLGLLLMSFDQIRLAIKYKNNPFYHGGKFKYNSAKYNYRPTSNSDEYLTPHPRNEEKVVPQDDVIDSNMSYFEMYEKRKEELNKIEEEFDQGKISEQEYQNKRKAIYAKYDRYN